MEINRSAILVYKKNHLRSSREEGRTSALRPFQGGSVGTRCRWCVGFQRWWCVWPLGRGSRRPSEGSPEPDPWQLGCAREPSMCACRSAPAARLLGSHLKKRKRCIGNHRILFLIVIFRNQVPFLPASKQYIERLGRVQPSSGMSSFRGSRSLSPYSSNTGFILSNPA